MDKQNNDYRGSFAAQDNRHACGACTQFDKIPFPANVFNPPQKDEYLKRICSKKCKDCPFISWPAPGPPGKPGPPGPKGDPGIFLNPVSEDFYLALPDDEKLKADVLWVVYPNGFLN